MSKVLLNDDDDGALYKLAFRSLAIMCGALWTIFFEWAKPGHFLLFSQDKYSPNWSLNDRG